MHSRPNVMKVVARHLPLLLLAGLALAATTGCAQPKYVHAVYFQLKPGTPQSEVDALVAASHDLCRSVPSVRRYETGRRDLTAVRDVNATDYDIGLIVYFDDRKGHDEYSEHPVHKAYVEKYRDKWAGVKVYDFIAE